MNQCFSLCDFLAWHILRIVDSQIEKIKNKKFPLLVFLPIWKDINYKQRI
jgi:hypothetical protein